MPKETVNGVTQWYGPRSQYDGVAGEQGRLSDLRELVIFVKGGELSNGTATLPAGATIVGNAIVEVTEAFALGGTSPVLNIGVSGTEGTNRLAQVSEAQAEALGTYSIASAGTLAANTPLAAAATVRCVLGGGGANTDGGVGRLKLVIPYKVV